MPQAARFSAKVYSFTGSTFRRVYDAGILLSAPSITREVSKPASDLNIDIALPWDNFGYGQSTGVNLADLVKVYALPGVTATNLNPTPVLVFQGHVEEITGVFSGQGQNHMSLRLFPIDALLARSLWKSGGSYVVNYAGADVDTIASDIIDDINSIYGATFFTKNLGNPALSITQTFTRNTHLDALTNAAAFMDSTWYWRVRETGQFDLSQWSDSTQVHTFSVDKHIDTITAIKSVMDVKNKVVVSWGGGPTDAEYTDAGSQTAYGRRMEIISDSGIGNSGSADAKGNGEIARLKNPFTKTQIVVNANYDIHTIRPGDTCKILNISNITGQMISGILRIVRVTYDGDLATLDLADVVDNFGREFSKIV